MDVDKLIKELQNVRRILFFKQNNDSSMVKKTYGDHEVYIMVNGEKLKVSDVIDSDNDIIIKVEDNK
jgi:hypothetical protein